MTKCTEVRNPSWPCWSAVLLLALTGPLRAQFYAVTDPGTLGGTNCLAYGINNHEQIVGMSETPLGASHAYMFEGGRMMDLGTLGGSNSWAYGINDNGWMVGASEVWMTNMHAFFCTNAESDSSMMDLGTLGGSNSAAWMVNMHGDMVGWASMSNGTQHAFFMTNGMPFHMMDLGTAGGTNSEAYCINSNRMVVGYATMSDGSLEPIMSTNVMLGSSSMMTMSMGNMGGAGGQSWWVNDAGTTAGEAQMAGGNHHAVVSASGGMMGRMNVDLGTLGGSNSIAYCINNAGSAVGSAQMTNGGMHAFVVTNALGGMVGMMDLNGLVPTNSGWELVEARGINAMGQIVGWGMRGGHTNAFLLTPVNGPVTMMAGPSSQILGAGATVKLTMDMSASEPLTYQWMRNGINLSGATNSSLDLAGMSSGMAGQYTVVVRNSVGTVGRASANMSVFSMALTKGSPLLMVAAPNGSQFQIEWSDALGAGASWQTMTNVTVTNSAVQMSDPSASGLGRRFYRAAMKP